MLEIKGLNKTYQGGDIAISDINLQVEKGEVIAIIGPSGAGKSTLIRCINRLVEVSKGQIILNGKEITLLKKRELRKARRKIGMIFQEYALVERLSVMENVLSGRLGYISFWNSFFRRFPQKDINEAFRLLKRLGLEEQYHKRADKMSGGQRQRVGIARALIQDPDLLLVDEPTASLDPKTSRQIMRLITELVSERNLTVLINIHDVTLAKQFVKRIIGMRDGEIVYDGSPEGLNVEILTRIYGEEDWQTLEDEQQQSNNSDINNMIDESKIKISEEIVMEA